MGKLKYCYHTHTARCGHATGEDEEYVKKAIELGIERLGFSDHIFLPDEIGQPGVRCSINELDNYIASINHLRGKYEDFVDISIGFEAEYNPQLLDLYRWLLKEKVQYLIMGQHCYLCDNKFLWYGVRDGDISNVQLYVDHVLKGLETGLFKYLAHPDLFLLSYGEWNEELERESRRLLEGCEKLNIPLEVNVCGMRRRHYNEVNYSYPNINFFKLASQYNLKFVIGIDAHDPSHFNQDDVNRAIDFANRAGIKIDWDYHL